MAEPGKYKQSLNLPKTDFPMRGAMARREPEMLAEWEKSDIYGQICASRAGAKKYVLHDGPPYSNGHLHHGHVLNKILKDLVVKYRTMAGYYAPYVPGWDTHGLPIELAVDRELGEKKRNLTKADIRKECRDYALKFVDIQRREFRRLGVQQVAPCHCTGDGARAIFHQAYGQDYLPCGAGWSWGAAG